MTDLDCIEYAIQVVLAKIRQRNPMSIPASGETVMQWLAAAINEAKDIRDNDPAEKWNREQKP